ncbi:hypothetical protein JZU61_06895, partial [bacterium]|nr:hypothetical protein [bacterium]
IIFHVRQYDNCKLKQQFTLPVVNQTGTLQVEDAIWKCDITESPVRKDGPVWIEAKFKLEKGTMKSSAVAVSVDFAGWSTSNYVMVPASVYNGNRFNAIQEGWIPGYPASMYYNKNSALTFSDNPRLSLNKGEVSKIELSTSSAATPAMTFYAPGKKRGFVMLTEQRTKLGNSGMIIEENSERTNATFSLTAPVVRERIPGFSGFNDSFDVAPTWKEGDEVVIRFSIYSFPVEDIPSFLNKFMDLRKSFTGENHPRYLTPMSAKFDLTKSQIDNYLWKNTYSIYAGEVDWSGFGYKKVVFQLGWVGGLMTTYPMIYSNDSLQLSRVSKTFDFVVDSMQGNSGYFYGIYADNKVQTELKREIPKELILEHPDVIVAMTRKNSDALFWFIKHFMLLKEQGNGAIIKPKWENAAKKLANAFVDTWNKNGEIGQYVDVKTGEIVIYNSTAAAIAPAGLVLASKYFNEPGFLKAAIAICNYYYNRDVVRLGLTGGHSGDIAQDADADSGYGLLESLMALYWATGDKQWIEKSKVVAAFGATWTISYDFAFPSTSDLGKLDFRATGAVWASVQNKHAAPGICTSSGDYIFKLYRATAERKYADLIRDIQDAHTEQMETPLRPTISIGSGGSWQTNTPRENYYGCTMERIQITDSEGKDGVGRLANKTSNGWTEANGILMAMELPGIYLQFDKNEMVVFDHVEAKVIERNQEGVVLEIKNPTAFDAQISIFAETSTEAKKPLDYMAFLKWTKVDVEKGKTCKIKINRK